MGCAGSTPSRKQPPLQKVGSSPKIPNNPPQPSAAVRHSNP